MISRTVTQPPGEPMEEPEETIHPDPEVVANAWVGDWRALEERAAADLEGYWAERAGELEWSRPWDTVLDESGAPFYRWFVGARTNIVSNAVDRHLTNSTATSSPSAGWVRISSRCVPSPTSTWAGRSRGWPTSSRPWVWARVTS